MSDIPLTALEFAMLVEQLGGPKEVEIDRASVAHQVDRGWIAMANDFVTNDVAFYTKVIDRNGRPEWQVYGVRRKQS